MMNLCRSVPMLAGLAVLSSACLAGGPAVQISAPPSQGRTTPAPAAVPAPQALAKVCLDAEGGDKLTEEFADRLRETIAASGAFSLAPTTGSCDLQLHLPGNLLQFQTAGGLMASTVVIVTSPSGHYLSTSITACSADDFKPCAQRVIAVAKLALLEYQSSAHPDTPSS